MVAASLGKSAAVSSEWEAFVVDYKTVVVVLGAEAVVEMVQGQLMAERLQFRKQPVVDKSVSSSDDLSAMSLDYLLTDELV